MNDNDARKIPCEVVQDLIPLYADNLVSEKTREIIDEHVARCPSCAEAVKDAKDSLEENFSCEPVKKESNDVDYLRKVRTSSRKKIIAGICVTLCLALIFAGIKVFVYGSPDYGYTMSIVSDSAGKYLDVNGTRIMADGTIYNAALAQQLFESAHPYIGDMPANNDLAFALGISKNTGAYANKLHTENEPYGWGFVFEETGNMKKHEEISRKMELYAPVLLALVDNCDEIIWSFVDNPENAPDEPAYKVTSEDASKLLGADVKSFGESPERVMELLYELGL